MVFLQNASHFGVLSLNPISIALLVFIAACCGSSLLLWRVWRFTISPGFHSKEPKKLPYWIPFIGHAISFFRNSDDLLTYGRRYFKDSRETYSLTIAGQQIYIVTSPRNIKSVYKNFRTLSFDGFAIDMYRTVGMSKFGVGKIFEKQLSKNRSHNRDFRSYSTIGSQITRQQLQLGSENFEELLAQILACIEAQIDPANVPLKALANTVSPASIGWQTVSLRSWTFEVLSTATMKAYFGDALPQNDPSFLDAFRYFESNSWMLTYKYPRILARSMYAALDHARRSLTQWHELPSEKRDGVIYWIREIDKALRESGINTRDRAINSQMIFWVGNANSNKVAFWHLAHIFQDPDLVERVRTEIVPALVDGKLNVNYLVNNCPTLTATYCETLRLTSAALSARDVVSRTVVGSNVLQPGTKLLVPFRQLHYDEKYFPNPCEFRPERFLENKKLMSAPYFRPFGGGTTHCPGRFLAERQIKGFVAVVLLSYDIDVVGKKKLPRLDMTKPTLGIMDPVDNDDVILRIRGRVLKKSQP